MIQPSRALLGIFYSGLILAGVAGCSTPRVHELPPPNYTLAGLWELNPALSSDTDKALASLQPKLRGDSGAGRGAGPGQGDLPAPEVINDPTTDLPPIDTSTGGRNRGSFGNGGYKRTQAVSATH